MINIALTGSKSHCCWVRTLWALYGTLLLLLIIDGRRSGGGGVIVASALTYETLIGICGKDFVLLAADASHAGGGLVLTSSDLDKIAILSPTSTSTATSSEGYSTQQDNTVDRLVPTTAVAAVGDTANADRLVGLLQAEYNMALYESYADFDVTYVDFGEKSAQSLTGSGGGTMNVHSVAQLARSVLSDPRSQPSVCLLVAGMVEESSTAAAAVTSTSTSTPKQQSQRILRPPAFSLARHVQDQVAQATSSLSLPDDANSREQATEKFVTEAESNSATDQTAETPSDGRGDMVQRPRYKPVLYWIDEYGAIQRVPYGVHGIASDLLWSLLDRHYHDEMTLDEALQLLHDCIHQLQTRYIVNTQPQFCVKCIDATGCRVIDIGTSQPQPRSPLSSSRSRSSPSPSSTLSAVTTSTATTMNKS